MPQAEATVDSRIVVIEMELEGDPPSIGLRTDKVHEVATLNRARPRGAPPAVGMRWRRDYVRELVRAAQAGGDRPARISRHLQRVSPIGTIPRAAGRGQRPSITPLTGSGGSNACPNQAEAGRHNSLCF